MIRRAFWLGAGAAVGIIGYRRASALGRRLVPSTVSTQSSPLASPVTRQRHAIRGTIRFARDVREGMDIYTSRHALPSGSTTASYAEDKNDRKDGR
jgi:hypothetical protein